MKAHYLFWSYYFLLYNEIEIIVILEILELNEIKKSLLKKKENVYSKNETFFNRNDII
jgi:hypothetical protein